MFYKIGNANLELKPIQKPHPPIWRALYALVTNENDLAQKLKEK